jgi:hypothetical protein
MTPEQIQMIADLWDSLSPRERTIRFRLGITAMTQVPWSTVTPTDKAKVLSVGHTLGMDYIRQPEPGMFSGAEKAKVETHH